MSKQCVVIVVPMYRVEMSDLETISWQQLQCVLGSYPIRMVAPISIAKQLEMRYQIAVEEFPNSYFQSVQSYSHMMLMSSFYQRFQSFEYMLVYQLDAFVFSDQLMKFCQMGYDYIGAPWPYWFVEHHPVKKSHVGNGGFSLRKIASACRVLEQKEIILEKMSEKARGVCQDSEDNFWSHCGCVPNLKFKVPHYSVARRFSVEYRNHERKNFAEHLPFGCHGWNKFSYWLWKPIIKRYGYDLPDRNMEDHRMSRKNVLRKYLLERILRNPSNKYIVWMTIQSVFPPCRQLAIWGSGVYGQLIKHIFAYAGVHVRAIYDQKVMKDEETEIRYPDMNEIRTARFFVVVATVTYENEICETLSKEGYQEQKDYIRISALMQKICEKYLKEFIE